MSLILAGIQTPAFAQTDGQAATSEGTPCSAKPKRSRGAALFGSILGNVMSQTMGRSEIANYVPLNIVSETLTDAIACRLDQDEQKKAASATDKAIDRGVNTTERWQSTTRENVSGSSTVTARTQTADGTTCMNVTDIVIVEGEETTVNKRMCRRPGQSGYTVAAA